MKYPLLLWLFLPASLSDSDPEYYVNGVLGTLEPVTSSSISEDTDYTQNPEDDTTTDMECDHLDLLADQHCVSVYLKDQRGLTKGATRHWYKEDYIEGNFNHPEGVGGFLIGNLTCMKKHLTTEVTCSWNAINSPPDAEYFVTISQSMVPTKCDCDKKDGGVIVCRGNIASDLEDLIVHVNVTCENFQYIHSAAYDPEFIVKLSPPQNVSALVIAEELHVKWEPPKGIHDDCLSYQLRINEDNRIRSFEGKINHTDTDVDLTKSNYVKIRVTQTKNCKESSIWSDWSAVVEVPPSKTLLNPVVIAAIVLGVPMAILAVFLVCRCHGVIEKHFPVPSPSMKVKQLLEADGFFQVLPAEHIEEITEILFVGNGECAKISE